MDRVSAPGTPPIDRLQVLPRSCSIMACKCISKLGRSRPPNASPNSLDRGLQVHLWVQLDLGLQVHLQTRSITASKCISEFTRSRPPSASPNSHNHGLQVHLQTRSITASSVSLNSHDYGLQTRSIPASKCISKLARSRSRSVSLCSLDHSLQVHLQTRSITASSVSLNSHDYGLQTCSITASKCTSKLARSRPWSVTLSSLDRHFQAHFQLLSSTACSQSRYTVCRWVAI